MRNELLSDLAMRLASIVNAAIRDAMSAGSRHHVTASFSACAVQVVAMLVFVFLVTPLSTMTSLERVTTIAPVVEDGASLESKIVLPDLFATPAVAAIVEPPLSDGWSPAVGVTAAATAQGPTRLVLRL
jgi:hypothetical protein